MSIERTCNYVHSKICISKNNDNMCVRYLIHRQSSGKFFYFFCHVFGYVRLFLGIFLRCILTFLKILKAQPIVKATLFKNSVLLLFNYLLQKIKYIKIIFCWSKNFEVCKQPNFENIKNF